MRWLCRVFLISALLPLFSQTLQTPGGPLTATKEDLTMTVAGQPAMSFRSALQPAFRKYAENSWENAANCCAEHDLEVISVTGTWVSLRDRFYAHCPNTAHPTRAARLATIDTAAKGPLGFGSNAEDAMLADEPAAGAPGKLLALNSLYSDAELLRAFRADPLLKPYFKTPPSSLEAVRALLPEDGIAIKKMPCKFTLSPDFLTRFALHHVEGGKLAVRVSLEPIGGACAGTTADLGLLLDWPSKIPAAARVLVVPKPAEKLQTKLSFCTGSKGKP